MKLDFEPGALRPIGSEQISRARLLATESSRRRGLVRYHDHDEPIQRMINAIAPDSYVRPHKHESPDKTEIFIALQGCAVLCTFGEDGELGETLRFGATGPQRGVEIPARTWHSLVALQDPTVLYEIIEGPFDARSHKRFAPWAPDESAASAARYLGELRQKLGLAASP